MPETTYFGVDFCQSRQFRLEEDLEVKDEKGSNETYGSCSQVNLTWLQVPILEDLKQGNKCHLYLYRSSGKKWLGTGNGRSNMGRGRWGFQAVI